MQCYFVNMATTRTRNLAWRNDEELKERLQTYVSQGLQNKEILSFLEGDFNFYAWSIRSLEQRLQYACKAIMHAHLCQNHGDMDAEDAVLYGPSTSNQVNTLLKSSN